MANKRAEVGRTTAGIGRDAERSSRFARERVRSSRLPPQVPGVAGGPHPPGAATSRPGGTPAGPPRPEARPSGDPRRYDPPPLRREQRFGPALAVAGEQPALVEAVGGFLPELDRVGGDAQGA